MRLNARRCSSAVSRPAVAATDNGPLAPESAAGIAC